MNKVDVLIGMQFGSEGKGLIAGHLACSGKYDTVVNVNMPNAGHTYIDKDGTEYMFKVLPNGAVSPYVKKVMIGPDSVFDPSRLLTEIGMVGSCLWNHLYIHENATILRPEHVISEKKQKMVEKFGSTAQGSAEAMIDKIRREEHAVASFDPGEFADCIVSEAEWQMLLRDSKKILLEGCQGWSLGLNSGFYPFCTSRDTTPGRLMSGARIPHHWADRIIGACRVHPIRVGGNSGPGYPDQTELTWEEINQAPEFTTVTNRQRRVFTFSRMQIADCIDYCGVTDVFLNFCNYDPVLASSIKAEINGIGETLNNGVCRVRYTGWGPTENDVHHEI